MSKYFSIGRADAKRADILLSGNTISAKHAEIYVDNNGMLLVSDLGSSNGTCILRSGKKLSVSSKAISLIPSDILSLGGNDFTVDALLKKIPTGGNVSNKLQSENLSKASGKMMRCSFCGSVTPKGSACVECDHHA